MKAYRYIAGLLLVCFSAFLGHNLVPHHHHAEVFHSPLATECPFEHGDQQEHDHDHDASADADEHPLHCHAFNDVVFQKSSIALNNVGVTQILDLEPNSQTLVFEAPPLHSSSPFTLLKLPFRSPVDLGTRILRGPPAFA